MTVVGNTKTINTNMQFVDLETEMGISLTANTEYSVQVQNRAEFKIGDAVFDVNDDYFNFVYYGETCYVRTLFSGAIITVLEGKTVA